MRRKATRGWEANLFTNESKGVMERTHEPICMTLVLKIKKCDFLCLEVNHSINSLEICFSLNHGLQSK